MSSVVVDGEVTCLSAAAHAAVDALAGQPLDLLAVDQFLGWQVTSINGLPAWIPPPWIDPEQRPRTRSRPG